MSETDEFSQNAGKQTAQNRAGEKQMKYGNQDSFILHKYIAKRYNNFFVPYAVSLRSFMERVRINIVMKETISHSLCNQIEH